MNQSDAPAKVGSMEGLGITSYPSGTISAARIERTEPILYRLARKKDRTLVLQGAYFWEEGRNYGHEWRDMPTVELDA